MEEGKAMSYELDYFPPQGTKWAWGSKALNYSPWVCNLADQREPGVWLWPLSVVLFVDKKGEYYTWWVQVRPFKGKDYNLKGKTKSALRSCKTAEEKGEKELDKHLPNWARTALKNGWRP